MTESDQATTTVRNQMIENQKILDSLNAELGRKTEEVRIIQQISSQLNSTLELDRILEIILDSMDSVLGFRHCMVLLHDEENEQLTLAASRGFEDHGIGATVKIGQGVLGVVAKRRRIMRMGNLRTQKAYLQNVRTRMAEAGQADKLSEVAELPGLPDVQSQIAIPLVVKDRLVGVFGVESTETSAFDELDELVLSIVANQVANAIDNARLHQSVIEHSNELDEANEQLSGLNTTLEAKVSERTVELSSALDDVNREKSLSDDLLKRMAPPEVIPIMLQNKLDPRRLQVTVLFTDLVGFTAYTANMEPDEIFSQLNHYFSWAGDIIQRYRGYVNKTNGDGIMALFGVPFESGTHHSDAALAALTMQQELHEQFPFDMRIGLNSGTVTAGMLGPENKSVYDVLGNTVNLASRMEGASAAGGIALSSDTAASLRPYFDLDPLGETEIKGQGTMTCFNLAGVRALGHDDRRIDPGSTFATNYVTVIDEVDAIKRDALSMVDLGSIQARDAALNHNEAVAAFALALLRFMKPDHPELEEIDERELCLSALLHDVGKRSLEPSRLCDPGLGADQRETLRRDLMENTLGTLDQLEMGSLAPTIQDFYRFEGSRGATGEYGAMVELLAAADIYDALTAPKIYKGAPWRIVGALEELLRLPYCQSRQRPVFTAFVDLMKPEGMTVSSAKRPQTVLR